MASSVGNYFLIILLLILFGLIYIYVDNYRFTSIERFSQSKCKNDFIIPKEKLAIIQGVNMPDTPTNQEITFDNDPSALNLNNNNSDPSASNLSNNSDPSQLFMFANNKASLDCCPSVYSTSQGCVCMTDDQINWLSQRGNNSRFSKCDGLRDI